MSVPIPVVVVSPEPGFLEEFRAAIDSLGRDDVVLHEVPDAGGAASAVRSRSPRLVVVDQAADGIDLSSFATQLGGDRADLLIAAVYRPDAAGGSQDGVALIEAVRAGVHDFLRRPVSSVELGDVLARAAGPAAERPHSRGRVAAFVSNKGGVGKSTLAVNTAVGLARRHPDDVLLVDASLQLGVCCSMLDIVPETSLLDASRERDRLDGTLLRELAIRHPSGLHLLATPTDPVAALAIPDDDIAAVVTEARRHYRFVVVDTFPLLDATVIGILDLCDDVVVVADPVVPTVRGVGRFLKMLGSVGVADERITVAINRVTNATGTPSVDDIETVFGRAVDHVLPYESRVLAAANVGRPIASSSPRLSKFVGRLRGLVDRIDAEVPSRNGRVTS
ncbi:MAG: AAA family ATPase [Planctomycetota bacterium]